MEFDNNVDLNLYRIFYCVAKTGSFSKAAEKLFVSQPSISYAIKHLEDSLKTKLFLRISKGVELTTEGKNLMFYVESAYNSLCLGEKMLSSNSNNLDFGEISLGAPSHIGLFFLAKYISNFHRRFPNIKIKVFNTSTTKLVELMEMHKIDLIIDTMPIIGKYRKINIKTLKEFEYCFAVSKNFKEMEIQEEISVEELTKLPLMLPQKENKNRNLLDLFFSNKNLSVNPIIEVSNTEMMIDFTRRGMGIGYFIKDSIRDYLEKGSFIEVNIKEELPIEKVAVAYVEDSLTVISKKFLDLFEEYKVNI